MNCNIGYLLKVIGFLFLSSSQGQIADLEIYDLGKSYSFPNKKIMPGLYHHIENDDDVIGGNTLATILKSTSNGGNVVCVGNIQGAELNTTVFPFILNGIKLLGVGTQDTEMAVRIKLWELLSNTWKPSEKKCPGLSGRIRKHTEISSMSEII